MKLDWNSEYVDEGDLEETDGYTSLLYFGENLVAGVTKIKDGSEPYIKIRRCDDNGNIIGVCRVCLKEPKYITGYNENMVLTDDEKTDLYSKLSTQKRINPSTMLEITAWDTIVKSFTEKFGYQFENVQVGMPVTDYRRLI